MQTKFRICHATYEPAVTQALADILIDCVEGGASVSFMSPLSHEKAIIFWENQLASAKRGERIILVAKDAMSSMIYGTVQVVLNMPENQPHRADVTKMLVHRGARRWGVGAALMRAAEDVTRGAGKTLLTLDTLSGGDAERLYLNLGWKRCGEIPGYALLPHGGLCNTTVLYKELVSENATDKSNIEPSNEYMAREG